MSMTDLFGSDVDESEEEMESVPTKEQSGDEISEHSDGAASDDESEQSGEEGDGNEDDEVDNERAEEEEREDDEVEVNEKDEESNEEDETQEVEEQEEEEEENGQEDEDGVIENHVAAEQDEDSEKEETSEQHKNVSSMDLFGEDVSSEEDEAQDENEGERDESRPENDASEVQNAESDQRQFLGSDGEEQEDEEKVEEETELNIEIPYSKFNLGSGIAFVKLPNFLSVETKPFLPSHYEDEIEEDEVLDEEGRARMKLRVENTIRWRGRKDEDGNEIKESNARIVTWSDGTMSLLLGGEIFDIHKTKIDGEHNHLFVQQGTGLQAQAIFHEKLTFRPHSTNSQTHRKMTLSIADRVSKTGKIKFVPVVGKDPESKKDELIKKEEEKLRAQLRRENQQRRMRERSHARGLTASYLEPDRYDDEEDALEQSLLEMKRKYKKGLAKGRVGDVYSDQESEEEGFQGGFESDDESGENATDKKTSEEDAVSRKHSLEEGSAPKKKRKVIESDEDESD